MKILVDADACPVTRKIETIAKKHGIAVILFSDTSHMLKSEYSEVRVIDKGRDAVDFAITSECTPNDIVVTHDYGEAAMILTLGAKAIHPNGRWYTEENIERLLMERYIAKKERGRKKHRIKAEPIHVPRMSFERSLEKMVMERKNEKGRRDVKGGSL